MNNQSILVSIQHAVDKIAWDTPKQKQKAMWLCSCVFNLYTINGYKFNDYVSLSRNYFITLFPSKRDYIIKQILVDNGIFECDHSYNVLKGIGKGYRFGKECFKQINITSSTITFTKSNGNSTISYLCPHFTTEYYQGFYVSLLERLTFEDDTDELIAALSAIQPESLTVNENIKDQYVYIRHEKQEFRYSIDKAISFALQTGNSLIKFKDKFYIDQPEYFIVSKSMQLKITYCQSIFNIKNGLYYCNRNDTNNRLDYNLTGLKKELFTKMKFDGEHLVELDIANAQFAIAAYINQDIDANFINNAHRGTLYSYVEKELELEAGMGKQLMFRVAFDKVKHDDEFKFVRKLFPKLMTWVDTYKQEHGYKLFSNLLQKKEAQIMIDGLLMHLIAKGYEVFTIHDALRVKQSQANEIMTIMNGYFDSIGFKCAIRQK